MEVVPLRPELHLIRPAFVTLTQVTAETACFGHGDPLHGPQAAATWEQLGRRCAAGPQAVPDPLG
jgi:hypothetical protein